MITQFNLNPYLRNKFSFLLLMFVSLALAACGGSSGGGGAGGETTWEVNLFNSDNHPQLSLKVDDATAAAFVSTPGSGYVAQDFLFTLTPGETIPVTLPCGVNFLVAAGGTALNTGGTLFPADCTEGGTSAPVPLTVAPTAPFTSSAFDLAAGTVNADNRFVDGGEMQFTYNVANVGDRVFVYTSGATGTGVSLRVAGGGSRVFFDSDRYGAGENAALAFSARAAGAHTITITNGSLGAQSGLTLHARTPAPLSSGAQAISLSQDHSCFLLSASAYCVGYNSDGQLGGGDAVTPVYDRVSLLRPVFGLGSGVNAISAGLLHTCAIHNGATKCWGYGGNGRLGDGTNGSDDCYDAVNRRLGTDGVLDCSLTPVQVAGLTSGVTTISAGGGHTCAIHSVGGNAAAKCWGYGRDGQLGDGSTNSSNTPVQVVGLTSGVTAISAGRRHTCAVHTVGGNAAAKCWGEGRSGRLGDGSTDDSNTPVQVRGLTSGVTAISTGWRHTCTIHTVGGNAAAKCWGYGRDGQLGDGTTGNYVCSSFSTERDCSLTPVQVAGLTSGVTAISAGEEHTCAIHSVGGNAAAKCWGYGRDGQLGDGTTGNYVCSSFSTERDCSLTPVQVRLPVGFVPTTLSTGSRAASSSCAISGGGRPVCWGSEGGFFGVGILGDGGTRSRSTPVPVYDSSGFGLPSIPDSSSASPCMVGDTLSVGESCTFSDDAFFILQDDRGCVSRGSICADSSLTLNGFEASKSGSTWTIDTLP